MSHFKDPDPSSQQHDPYAAFRVPSYRLFLIGSLLLQIGKAGQALAISWEIYQRTNQPLALGLTGLVQALPMFLFTLPAGVLADVLDRKKLIIGSLLGTGLMSLALATASASSAPVKLIYLILFLDASMERLGSPARTAILPLLVPRDTFENAVKWRTSLSQISGMLGPMMGGFLIARSLTATYVIAAGASMVFILFLLRIHIPLGPVSLPGRMFTQVSEGIQFLWRRKIVLGAVSLDMFAVLLGGATYLLPIFARDIFDLSALGISPEQALGWLRAAPAAGALFMALILAHLPPMRKAGKLLLWSVAGFGLATIGFGLSRNFWFSWAMLFLTGLFDNISVVVRHTLVQMATPNEMRGRVSAVNSIFIGSSNQLGGFESGMVAHLFGPIVSVVSGGVGTLLVVASWTFLFPGLRRFGTFLELDREDSPPPKEVFPC